MVKSLFMEFMGDSPMMRVMDYLLTERELDFSITDIAKHSGIGRATLYRIWDNLINNKIIVHTREIGKAKLFKLNIESEKIKKLIEIKVNTIIVIVTIESQILRQKLCQAKSIILKIEELIIIYSRYLPIF